METRRAKMIVNKGGKGGSTFRATLPTKWIRGLELSEEDRDLRIIYDDINDRIIIENANKELDVNIVYQELYKLADENIDVNVDEIVNLVIDKIVPIFD